MQRHLGEFETRGAQVVAIGQGTGAEAERMARRLRLGFPVLGDPDHDGYRAVGLGRTDLFGLTLKPFLESPAEAFRNLRQADLAASASPRSDVRRLGGALVVDRGGRIRFLHRSRTTTDVPATADLLAALDALEPAGRAGSA